MKMFKDIIRCIIALITLICVFAVGVCTLVFNGIPLDLFFDHQIRRIPVETDTLPPFVKYGVLHYKGEEYVIEDFTQTPFDAYVEEVVCIKGNAAYIICTYEYDWHVVSWDFETKELSQLCRLTNPDGYGYDRCENGFYIDSKIILTDMQKVVEYDIETSAVTSCSYSEYDFPQPSSYGHMVNYTTLSLMINNEEHIVTLEEMQQDSPSLAAIPNLHFFQNGIQMANDKVFVVMETKNRMGESYAVLAEYKDDVWKYVNSYFTGDIASRRCYVVPST